MHNVGEEQYLKDCLFAFFFITEMMSFVFDIQMYKALQIKSEILDSYRTNVLLGFFYHVHCLSSYRFLLKSDSNTHTYILKLIFSLIAC